MKIPSDEGMALISALVAVILLGVSSIAVLVGSKYRFFAVRHLGLRNDVTALRRYVKGGLDCSNTMASVTCTSSTKSIYYTNFISSSGTSIIKGPAPGQIGSYLLRWSCDSAQMYIEYAKFLGTDPGGTIIFDVDPLTKRVLSWQPLFDTGAKSGPICAVVPPAPPPGTGGLYYLTSQPLTKKGTACSVGNGYVGESWEADVACANGPPAYYRPVQGSAGCQFNSPGGNLLTSYPDPGDPLGLQWHVECCATKGAGSGPMTSPGFASLSCMQVLPPWSKITGDLKREPPAPPPTDCMPWMKPGSGVRLTAHVVCPNNLDPITPGGDKPQLVAIGGGASCPLGGYVLNSQSEVLPTGNGYAYSWRVDCCAPDPTGSAVAAVYPGAAWAVCSASPDAAK